MQRDPPDGWALTGHACRHCMARIIERDGVFRCSTCAARAEGAPTSICGCGIIGGSGLPGRRLFACTPNPAPGPAHPALVVIGFATQ